MLCYFFQPKNKDQKEFCSEIENEGQPQKEMSKQIKNKDQPDFSSESEDDEQPADERSKEIADSKSKQKSPNKVTALGIPWSQEVYFSDKF